MQTVKIYFKDIRSLSKDFNTGVDERFLRAHVKGDLEEVMGIKRKKIKLFGKELSIPYLAVVLEPNKEETHVYSESQAYYREFGDPYTEEDLKNIGRKIDPNDRYVHFLPLIFIELKRPKGFIYKIPYNTVEEAEKAFEFINKQRMLEEKEDFIVVEAL